MTNLLENETRIKEYVVLHKLSDGGYSHVYVVQNTNNNLFFALKIFDLCEYKTGLRNTKQHKYLMSLNIPNIITLFDSFDINRDELKGNLTHVTNTKINTQSK